jgi:hypothetical protein
LSRWLSLAAGAASWKRTTRRAVRALAGPPGALAGGEGASEAKLAAIIPLQKMGGTPEVASSSLLRYLAEAAWLPTALLPRSGVSWLGTRTAARARRSPTTASR